MSLPIAIDTDPGVDDAIALMLALRSPELSVELITSVAGNVPVKTATRNAKRILGLLNPPHWPLLAEGAAAPLRGKLTTATAIHNSDGLGGNASRLPVPRHLRAQSDAPGALVEFARKHGQRGVIVALGPLTNLARAIDRDPQAMATTGRLIVMGGAVRVPGNITAVAEFNIYVDPEAADRVLGCGIPTMLVPLDVTQQVCLTEARLRRAGRSALATAARHITSEGVRDQGGMPMHDALAVAVAIDASLVGIERLGLRVETSAQHTRGMTVADLRTSPATDKTEVLVDVATSVRSNAVLELLDRRVLGPRNRRARNGRVTVVGSANMDLLFAVDELPTAGETVLGRSMVQAFGGKGANQALAAHRAGASVSLVARFGNDRFGDEWLEFLSTETLDASASTRDPSAPTGVAAITVASNGDNQITVATGANATLSPRILAQSMASIREADVLVTQLEIPVATVKKALREAHANGVLTIHNPAPAQPLDDAMLALVDVLICNEVEAGMLCGMSVRSVADARRAARELRAQGIANPVITLGGKGVVLMDAAARAPRHLPAMRVRVVDTTGAGDTLVGYCAAALAQGMPLVDALTLANRAAAISVTKRGTVPSIPSRDDVG